MSTGIQAFTDLTAPPDPSLKRRANGRPPGSRTPDGKAKASRNAYKGGTWLMLRELTRLVNAEVKAARELVESVEQ